MYSIVALSGNTSAVKIENLIRSASNSKGLVVTDIHQCMQEIFAKRPKIVCIHANTPGITAASFALHIQRLLGEKTPSFVLLHEGADAVVPVKGLFDHLLDLDLPQAELEAAAVAIFKSILGPDWKGPDSPELPVGSIAAMTTQNSLVQSSLQDELLAQLQDGRGDDNGEHFRSGADAATVGATSEDALLELTEELPLWDGPFVDPLESVTLVEKESDLAKKVTTPPQVVANAPEMLQKTLAAQAARSPLSLDHLLEGVEPAGSARVMPLPSSATMAPRRKHIQEAEPALPSYFGVKDRSRMRGASLVLALLAAMAAGGWYLLSRHPQLVTFPRSPKNSASAPRMPAAKPAVVNVPKLVAKPELTARVLYPIPAKKLLSFVRTEGRDGAYSQKNPGWERYVAETYECRIFREGNHIKAVQVLGIKGHGIGKELLNKILFELVGTSAYQVTSQVNNGRYLTKIGTVANKAELMIYTQGAKIRATVITLD